MAILVAVLNLSSMSDITDGIENMLLVESLEDIIENEALPFVNKSLALLTISNLFTMSKKVDISRKTLDFAFWVLSSWSDIKENNLVVMNLVYSSLTICYNITLRQKSPDTARRVINCLGLTIMDHFKDP